MHGQWKLQYAVAGPRRRCRWGCCSGNSLEDSGQEGCTPFRILRWSLTIKPKNYGHWELLNPSLPEDFPDSLRARMAIATAAGTAGAYGRENQARQMCMAHDKVMSMPSGCGRRSTLLSFARARRGRCQWPIRGGFYGLIPYAVSDDLQGIEATATGKGFLSMDPSNWKNRDDHYCCHMYGVGCRAANPSPIPSVADTHQVMGSIDAI